MSRRLGCAAYNVFKPSPREGRTRMAVESLNAVESPEASVDREASSCSHSFAVQPRNRRRGLFGLAERVREPELMDDPSLDPREHERALRGLARLNAFSNSVNVVWRPIRDLARRNPGRRLRVLDVATGCGDVPIGLKRRADAAGVPLDVSGCDLSPVAIETAARRAKQAGAAVDWFPFNALEDDVPGRWDVIVSSLFLHHLDEEPAIELLRKLGAAGDHVIVNDLDRGPLNYALVWLGTRLLSRSHVVHVDGLLSVRAAFSVPEARCLAERAGLVDAQIVRCFPGRWRLTWTRT